MKFKLSYIMLAIFCLFVWILVFSLFNRSSDNTVKFFAVDNKFIWQHDDNGWNQLLLESDYVQFRLKKFNVYSNNKYVGKYSFSFTNGVAYYFDKNYKSYHFSDEIFAFSADSDIKFINYQLVNNSEDDIKLVYNYLNKLNLSNSNVSFKKYVVNSKKIYFVTNYVDHYDSEIFCIVFYKSLFSNKLIYKDFYKDNYFKNYDLAWVFNFGGYSQDNLVFKYNCDDSICYDLFSYDNKYVKVIDSKI